MVNAGLLVPLGQTRRRYYVAGAELTPLRRQIIDARDDRDDSDPFGGPA